MVNSIKICPVKQDHDHDLEVFLKEMPESQIDSGCLSFSLPPQYQLRKNFGHSLVGQPLQNNTNEAKKEFEHKRDTGVYYYERGEYTTALKRFNKAIQLNSGDASSYYYRGLTHAKLGNLKQALADLNRAYELDPYDMTNDFVIRLDLAEQLGRHDIAIQILELMRENELVPALVFRLAQNYFYDGQFEKAFETLIEIENTSLFPTYNLYYGASLYEMGDANNARGYLESYNSDQRMRTYINSVYCGLESAYEQIPDREIYYGYDYYRDRSSIDCDPFEIDYRGESVFSLKKHQPSKDLFSEKELALWNGYMGLYAYEDGHHTDAIYGVNRFLEFNGPTIDSSRFRETRVDVLFKDNLDVKLRHQLITDMRVVVVDSPRNHLAWFKLARLCHQQVDFLDQEISKLEKKIEELKLSSKNNKKGDKELDKKIKADIKALSDEIAKFKAERDRFIQDRNQSIDKVIQSQAEFPAIYFFVEEILGSEDIIALLNPIIDRNEGGYAAHFVRGLAYHALGQEERAMEDYEIARSLKPEISLEELKRRASHWLDPKQKYRDYETILELDPKNLQAYEEVIKYNREIRNDETVFKFAKRAWRNILFRDIQFPVIEGQYLGESNYIYRVLSTLKTGEYGSKLPLGVQDAMLSYAIDDKDSALRKVAELYWHLNNSLLRHKSKDRNPSSYRRNRYAEVYERKYLDSYDLDLSFGDFHVAYFVAAKIYAERGKENKANAAMNESDKIMEEERMGMGYVGYISAYRNYWKGIITSKKEYFEKAAGAINGLLPHGLNQNIYHRNHYSDTENTNGRLYLLLGHIYLKQKKVLLAIDTFKKVIETAEPKNQAKAYYELAKIYFDNRQWGEAQQTLDDSLSMMMKVPHLFAVDLETVEIYDFPVYYLDVYDLQVQLALAQDDVDGAIDILEKILRLEPNRKSSVLQLGRIYTDRKELDQVVDIYNSYLEKFPEDTDILHEMAKMYADLNNFEDHVVEYTDKILGIDPDYPIDKRIARAYAVKGRNAFFEIDMMDKEGSIAELERVFRYFDRAIAIDPERPNSYSSRAVCLNHLGKYRDASQDLTKAIEIYTRYQRAPFLATTYLERAKSWKGLDRMDLYKSDMIQAEKFAKESGSQIIIDLVNEAKDSNP